MKATVKETEGFKPITIQLTFETIDELTRFHKVVGKGYGESNDIIYCLLDALIATQSK